MFWPGESWPDKGTAVKAVGSASRRVPPGVAKPPPAAPPGGAGAWEPGNPSEPWAPGTPPEPGTSGDPPVP